MTKTWQNLIDESTPSDLEANWESVKRKHQAELRDKAKTQSKKNFDCLTGLVCDNKMMTSLLAPLSTLAGQTNGTIILNCILAILAKSSSLALKIVALYELQQIITFPSEGGDLSKLNNILIIFLAVWGSSRIANDVGDSCLTLAQRRNNLNLTGTQLLFANLMPYDVFYKNFMYMDIDGSKGTELRDAAFVSWRIVQLYYQAPDFLKNVFSVFFSTAEVITLPLLFVNTTPTTIGITLGVAAITNLAGAVISSYHSRLKSAQEGEQANLHVQSMRNISQMLNIKTYNTSSVEFGYYENIQDALISTGRKVEGIKWTMKAVQSIILAVVFGLVLSDFAKRALDPEDLEVELGDVVFLVNFFLLVVAPLTAITDSWLNIVYETSTLNRARLFLIDVRKAFSDHLAQALPEDAGTFQQSALYQGQAPLPLLHPNLKNVIVRFNHVNFGYGSTETFQDINFEIQKDEVVALLGPSGIGKSTLLNLLLGNFKPTHGEVQYFNADGYEITYTDAANTIATVPQDTLYFSSANFLYNIKYGHGHPDNYARPTQTAIDARAVSAIEKSLLKDVYDRTGNGTSEAKGLSGGEKKRVGIARALLRTPRLLILDEPTEGLDPPNAAVIINTFNNLNDGGSLVIITHDIPTIKKVNKILFVYKTADGKVHLKQDTYDNLSHPQKGLREFKEFIALQTVVFHPKKPTGSFQNTPK